MKITDFTVEYQKNPIGLDVEKPAFSWKIESEKPNCVQRFFQLQVMTEGNIVWNTDKIESAQSLYQTYKGEPLRAETEYQCRVNVWDNHDEMEYADLTFETGLMTNENIVADFITCSNYEELGKDVEESEKNAIVPVFFRKWKPKKKVKKARIYATALGIYEVLLDYKKVGELFFAPGWTSYHHRLQYQTYNVTSALQSMAGDDENKSEHTIAIRVANGWYKGVFGFTMTPNNYGDTLAALLELHVIYEDGTTEIVKTDESWKVSAGEIRSSEIYLGEQVNTNIFLEEQPTQPVVVYQADKSRIVAQESEPVRITKHTRARALLETPKGELVLDFGQNMAGVVQIQIKGDKGKKLTIHHAEVLDKDGNFYPDTLRQATSTDTYILNGTRQTLLPHFTFHGFRYIRVEGLKKEEIVLEDFTACTLHTDMRETGSFTCSNPLVNRLHSNIQWGMRSNFLDVPTDCPQRDERLGWTGDAQVFCGTASFHMQTALFFRKWLRDMAEETTKEYGVPHVVPNILGNQNGAAAWSDAATIIPWTVYNAFGDKRILEEQFACMKSWVDYITGKTGANGLWQTGFQYGDWLALDKEESADRTGATDKYLVANAYYAYSCEIVAKAADIVGKKEEAEQYRELHQKIKEAFNDEYITKTGRMVSETQTGCILALDFGLAKEEYRERILKSLLENIANHKNHLATGFVGTPYLCHTLSENGAHELAGTLFLREDYPSWLYAVKMGATTIWERWNSIMPDGSFDVSGMNSLNHYAYGCIGDWMYRKLAGLNQMEPGYKRFYIKPMFIKGINELKLTLDSPYGKIVSGWSCKNRKITVDVEIPCNTTAILYLPEKEGQIELGSGTYHYEYETKTSLEIERFSMESTLREIAAEPLAVELFNQMAPGMLDGPMIQFAYGMTMAELLGAAPEAKPMYEAVIQALNAQG